MQSLPTNFTTDGERNATFKVEGKEDGLGYLSPVNTTASKGLVVIQEWWGMNKSITLVADRFAGEGFRVICPDMYRGQVAKDHEHASHLMGGLDFKGAVQDILGAGEYLKSLGCTKVFLTGFCMGGALAIAALTMDSNGVFSAGSPFYGIPDLNVFKIENIRVPVIANFAANDKIKHFSDVEAAQGLEAKAKEAGLTFTLHIWENVDHAFMNQDSPNYEPSTASLALAETVEFFNQNSL